jgi:hypothetical protein
MVISGYVNYGVPGHEEENVFTISAPHLEASSHQGIIITLSKGMWVSVTNDDKLKVGWVEGEFFADDIISTDGKDPVFRFLNERGPRVTNKLEWEIGSI